MSRSHFRLKKHTAPNLPKHALKARNGLTDMALFKAKICGITQEQDLQAAIQHGADAIGLNFYRKSKRYLAPEIAEQWKRTDDSVKLVGVFVNASEQEIVEITNQLSLDGIQLHGDEDASILDGLRYAIPEDTFLVRAIRTLSDEFSIPNMKAEINRWSNAGVDLLLLDAAEPGAYGGTGKRLDWDRVSQMTFPLPWILAGGLTPGNVGEAISKTKPNGVDVASFVESKPGKKDEKLMKEFLHNAKEAFAKEA